MSKGSMAANFPADLRQDQLAPHSIEAEEAVLGSILLNPEALMEVIGFLTVDDFFIFRNGWIYETILKLHERRDPVDHLTVVTELEFSGRLPEVGGAAYIISLINKTPSALNVEGYGHIVSRMAYRRRLVEFAQHVARSAHSDETAIDEIHTMISKELSELAGPQAHVFATAEAMFGRFADDLVRKIDDARNGKPHIGLNTGLPALDVVFGGDLRTAVYNILFGPTGVGKTWAMLQMALALVRQVPVVYVTLENTEESLRERLIALETHIPYTFVRSGMCNGKPLDDEQESRLLGASVNLSVLPLEVVDHLTSASQIMDHLRAATIRHGRPGICFVDTLNQLADAVGRDKRYENLTKASAQLLQTMRLTGWGIVAGAQQRLELEAGMSVKRAKSAAWPTKYSLEGARTVVQHVRNLVGMYSPDYIAKETNNPLFDDPDCQRGVVLFVNVKANDNPGDGEGRLYWQSGIPRFESVATRSVSLGDLDLDMPTPYKD